MEAFIAQPNDPRICQHFAIGLVREGIVVSVVLTPAEARDKALKLWTAAEAADRAMDAALQGGKEGI